MGFWKKSLGQDRLKGKTPPNKEKKTAVHKELGKKSRRVKKRACGSAGKKWFLFSPFSVIYSFILLENGYDSMFFYSTHFIWAILRWTGWLLTANNFIPLSACKAFVLCPPGIFYIELDRNFHENMLSALRGPPFKVVLIIALWLNIRATPIRLTARRWCLKLQGNGIIFGLFSMWVINSIYLWGRIVNRHILLETINE